MLTPQLLRRVRCKDAVDASGVNEKEERSTRRYVGGVQYVCLQRLKEISARGLWKEGQKEGLFSG